MLSWVEHEKSFITLCQDLHCLLKESLDTTKCIKGEQMPRWDFVDMQDDVKTLILHMLEGKILLDTAHIRLLQCKY